MRLIEGLIEEPLTVAVQWSSREYATRVPVDATFSQWSLQFEVASPLTDVVVARIVTSDEGVRFGKDYRSSASKHHTLVVAFLWDSFGSSDKIAISFTGKNDLVIDDRDVGLRPKELVEVVPTPSALTGSVITLARIPHLRAEIQVAVLAKSDTKNSHGRWAINAPASSLPATYQFLASGGVSG